MKNHHKRERLKQKFIRWARIDPYLAVELLGVPCLDGCAICGEEMEPMRRSPLPGTYRYVCHNCVALLGWGRKGGAE